MHRQVALEITPGYPEVTVFTHLPLLNVQQGLLRIPPGPARFEAYVGLMTGPNETLALPLAVLNPMAKSHVAERLEQLLEGGAETHAADAVAEANARLDVPEPIRLALVVADDVAGGWTNRYLTDTGHRFEPLELRYGFATVLLWASESYTAASLTEQVLAACHRTRRLLDLGPPTTLRQMLAQEGQAAAFAGTAQLLDAEELAYTRAVITPHLDTTSFPTAFACLYGDAAARSVGYKPLGLSVNAGYALALDDASRGSATGSSSSVS